MESVPLARMVAFWLKTQESDAFTAALKVPEAVWTAVSSPAETTQYL